MVGVGNWAIIPVICTKSANVVLNSKAITFSTIRVWSFEQQLANAKPLNCSSLVAIKWNSSVWIKNSSFYSNSVQCNRRCCTNYPGKSFTFFSTRKNGKEERFAHHPLINNIKPVSSRANSLGVTCGSSFQLGASERGF